MSDNTTNDVVAVASVTGVVGLAIAFVKSLFSRAVQQSDDKSKEQDDRIDVLEKELRVMQIELFQIKGVVTAESWGLVSVVGKLNTNVEKLTMAVEHVQNAFKVQQNRSTPHV
jgi:hypothetical protein